MGGRPQCLLAECSVVGADTEAIVSIRAYILVRVSSVIRFYDLEKFKETKKGVKPYIDG